MTRDEIRRRALRAAVSATMSVAMLGCGSTVIERHDSKAGAGGGAGALLDMGDATGTTVVAATASSSSSGGAGGAGGGTSTIAVGGAGGAGGQAATSTVASAGGGNATPLCDAVSDNKQNWPAYVQCCEQVNWSEAAGCEAWGPPMPPPMDWTPQMEVA